MAKDAKEEENLFDEVEGQEDADTSNVDNNNVEEDVEEMAGDPDEQIQEITPEDFSDTAPADRIKKIDLNGMTLPIRNVRFTRPKTSDFRTGEKIDPIESDSGALYYRAKLVLEFDLTDKQEEELEAKNVAEYVPNVKYFVNDGKVARVPRIPRRGESQVAQLFRLYAKTVGKDVEEISDKEFVTNLSNYSAKLKTTTGKFKGREWFRNDVAKLIEKK